MPDTIERRLQAAADATDTIVAGWSDAVDLPSARAGRHTRTIRGRLVYPALCAAAVAAVIAAVLALPSTSPAQHGAAAGIGTPASPASTAPVAPPAPPASSPRTTVVPPPSDPPARARHVLTRALVGLRDVTTRWATDGSYDIGARYWQGGAFVATVGLSVIREAHPSVGNPCVLAKGAVAGHQGAPAPDDVCTALRQPDGTVVWVWKQGHSAYRPWTTARTKDWNIVQVRGDGTVVSLDVTSLIGTGNSGQPIYASTPFDIPESTLVRIVTDPQVTMGGPCTHDCTQLSGAPGTFAPPAAPGPTPRTAPTPHS